MNQPIPESLLTATAELLQKHPPFDEMERDVLHFLAGRLRLSYHARNNVILSPEVGEPASFYIIQRGTVHVLRRSPYQSGDGGSVTLRSGESFSVGALLEKRPVSHPYIAAEDTFCYQLAAQDFHELLQRSPRFHAFCTRYVTSLRQINRSIAGASDLAQLQQASCDMRSLGGNMLGQGVSAEQLTLIISALNDALTQRIIELEAQSHDLAGIEWCWLAFGSEGRYEQTLSTDQDNGLIFVWHGAADAEAVRSRLLPFARNINQTLDACGFPLCKGNIMAGNAKLCLSLPEWERDFSRWVRVPEPEALLNASIFFDFRPISGAAQLAATLREKLRAMTRDNPRFLRMMAQNALQVAPPLGVLRDFVVDEEGDYPNTIDLKQSGARLFVDAARVFSLAQGVANTSTAQRLRHAGTRMKLGADGIASAIDGQSLNRADYRLFPTRGMRASDYAEVACGGRPETTSLDYTTSDAAAGFVQVAAESAPDQGGILFALTAILGAVAFQPEYADIEDNAIGCERRVTERF